MQMQANMVSIRANCKQKVTCPLGVVDTSLHVFFCFFRKYGKNMRQLCGLSYTIIMVGVSAKQE